MYRNSNRDHFPKRDVSLLLNLLYGAGILNHNFILMKGLIAMAEELINDNGAVEESTEPKTYTQEEVDELLQRETDRRVTSALKKQEQKKEAQRFAQMSAEDQLREELNALKAELAEKDRLQTLADNKAAASKVLADKGLNLSLVDLVVVDDADEMNNRIKLLDKAFKDSVKSEVENRLKSKSPIQTLDTSKTYTKDDFKKLSLREMQELYKEQPELFND